MKIQKEFSWELDIHTERLHIRRFRQEDLDELCQLLADEAVMRCLEPPFSAEDTRNFLNGAGLNDSPLIWAVDDLEGRFTGYVICHPYGAEAFEIGWVLRRDAWHQGFARELTESLIKEVVGKTRYLILECAPEQMVTRKIALSCRFRYMGHADGCDVYRRECKA